ncbi:hypothetical protein P168DRAFT_280041 [Aspergillus campestris IBT 28561]|uniref:Uncharacterized protein n=1 Tax=Aspergillus campestris (strain IBT 28561) TaxID=1392248 RepID=A0A2I1D9U3_ASPC2|nr:uncharacterized protein P168DRAFT_280041 [Aspergillus campestris IBT 28561]PKY06636.1 hypothetical protein P168DRAFT_280041 [Aspergillus campestris IBT 28561]
MWIRIIYLLSGLILGVSAAEERFPPNANHIFNAVHSSMRQWGSSLHHNGMSFFLASVPAGTQLYHGNTSPEPVNGTEWLAFEPEHALVFTKPFPHGPPPPPDQPHGRSQKPLQSTQEPESEDDPHQRGWLHTYTTAKDLRLLYVDGMSAAKTDNGTMDSQDRILFHDKLEGRPAMQERERADLACQMAREMWNGRLDGLLRMEAGFEVILCDFGRDLNVVRVTRVKGDTKRGQRNGSGGNGTSQGNELGGARLWYKAAASRYGGIGGRRVALNYDHFVSAFAYGLDLFRQSEDTGVMHPRLTNVPSQDLDPIRQDLSRLILDHDPIEVSFDWQAIADMVVERYGRDLRYMTSGQLTTMSQLEEEIESTLIPFIDYDDRNTSSEVDRCSYQFIPAEAPQEGLAALAVRSVARSICTTLVDVWSQSDYPMAIAQLQELTDYLSWTTWKECGKCPDNEICMVPLWPLGTIEDYKHPECRDASMPNGKGRRYWGTLPQPPAWR